MLDILSLIPNQKKQTTSGWTVFNAVCCHHNGHSVDRRRRAGVIFTDQTSWSYNCFNCGFKCSYSPGKNFSIRLKQLLSYCGVTSTEIQQLNLQNLLHEKSDSNSRISVNTTYFSEKTLPDTFRNLNPQTDTVHVQYLQSRALCHTDYCFMVDSADTRPGIVIPYFYKSKIVGYTTRYYDNKHPKYISHGQRGYLFNIDVQTKNSEYLILVEGQFDAIAIGGVAYTGSNISTEQAALLRSTGKKIIVVPDRDQSGMAICQSALDLGYMISIPPWDSSVKDANDAIKRYGKLPTLLSIMQHATDSKIKLRMKGIKLKA